MSINMAHPTSTSSEVESEVLSLANETLENAAAQKKVQDLFDCLTGLNNSESPLNGNALSLRKKSAREGLRHIESLQML